MSTVATAEPRLGAGLGEASLRPASLGITDRLARWAVTANLSTIERGQIRLEDAVGATSYGESGDLEATVRVHRPRFYRHAILGGTLSVAESYLQGDWDCDDLTALFRIFTRNLSTGDALDAGVARVAGVGHRLFHRWHANDRSGSRRNIHAHYDLGNAFFALWLDETMAYSSGVFPDWQATMYEASVEKFDRICRRLQLGPADHLLEIGSGWGGLALHAASRYGCRVTTTTISREQYDAAVARVAGAGLADRVTVLLEDYRDLTGQYDKLVSIEMIEAVGHENLDTYFRKCGQLLRPGGSFVLQAIVMPERRYRQYLRSVDFIQRYIFPGGCLPSHGAMLDSVARTGDLRLVYAEDFALHYAETLRRWRRAFHEREHEVRQLGYSEQFLRMWHYYLCYCEAAFEERYVGLSQIQFDKPS